VNPLFLKYLIEQAGSEVYFTETIQNQEAKERAENIKNEKALEEALGATFSNFRTEDQSYANNVRVLPKEEATKVVEGSTYGEVITCLWNDSLNLGLGVFRKLGLFAIGCGLLFFLLLLNLFFKFRFETKAEFFFKLQFKARIEIFRYS